MMYWKCYEKVFHGKTRSYLDNKVLKLQYKDITTQVFLSYLKPRLHKFIRHNFVAHFQEKQYKTCFENFPPENCMFVIDFAKNYIFQNFNEIQEMHWHSFQLTILVWVFYQWNLAYISNPNLGAKKLITKYHYQIFDNNKHDNLSVQHCFKQHQSQLNNSGLYYNEHLVWLDGCAIQCKSRRTQYHVDRYAFQLSSLKFHAQFLFFKHNSSIVVMTHAFTYLFFFSFGYKY